MIKTIIIEDEKLATNALVHTLSEISDDVQIESVIGSVSAGIEYLSQKPDIDIIFSDVQLPDGLSFEIFKATEVKTPVIFIIQFIQDIFIKNKNRQNRQTASECPV